MLKKAVFFIREFDPDGNVPTPYSHTGQWNKLLTYCDENGLIFAKYDCMILEPAEYSLPFGEQEKIRNLLTWLDDNPGFVLLTCSLAHISADRGEIESFRRELTIRRVELISLKPGEEKLKPIGLTDEHMKIMRSYVPSLLKIFTPLKNKKFSGNPLDLQTMTLKELSKDEQLYPILKERLEDKIFYHFGAKGKESSRPDRFFWKEVYGQIFKYERLQPIGKDEIDKGVNKIIKQEKHSINSKLTD